MVPVAAAASAPVAETPSSPLALAVNAPLGWAIGSFGVSPSVRLGEHLAVRGNLARYKNGALLTGTVGAFTDNDGTGYGGTIFDVGIVGIWYPRRVWDGPLLEVGVLRRDRDVYVWPEFESQTFTRSTEYAGRTATCGSRFRRSGESGGRCRGRARRVIAAGSATTDPDDIDRG